MKRHEADEEIHGDNVSDTWAHRRKIQLVFREDASANMTARWCPARGSAGGDGSGVDGCFSA